MNRDKIKNAIEGGHIEWLKHSLERMMQRGISIEVVEQVLLSGKIIEDYPDNKPYPSAPFLGWVAEQPFHVVAAYDSQNHCCHIITAYKPDLDHFESDYKTRR